MSRGDWPPSTMIDRQSPKLIADLQRRRAFRFAMQIGRSRRDGQSGGADDGQRNFRRRHSQCHVAGIGCHLQRQLGIGFHDDGQRSRPEAAGQQVEDLRHRPGQFRGLVDRLDQQRQRLVARARLDLVDAIDRMQIEGVDSQTIKGIGRHAQHFAGADLLRRVGNQRGFRFFTIDLDDFGTHRCLLFVSRLRSEP